MEGDAKGIERAIELTNAVQSAIDAGDWGRAAELERERRGAVEALVVGESGRTAFSAALADLLVTLEARSRALVGDVHHHRRRIEREAETTSRGHSAVTQYASTSRAS